MKKIFYIPVCVILLAACNDGAEKSKTNADSLTVIQKEKALTDSSSFTSITWIDSTAKDLGKVKKGQTVEIPFPFKNIGNKPLIISAVEPGCGCTVGEKPEKPVMPGATDKVVAQFNSEGQTIGFHNKTMVVRANTKPQTEHVLIFKVEVTE